jgi:hypothetical protein
MEANMQKWTITESFDASTPVGIIELDLTAISIDKLDNVAIVPGYITSTGRVVAWSVVPIDQVSRGRS